MQIGIICIIVEIYSLNVHSTRQRTDLMKPGIHPEYRDVLFHDTTADTYYVIGSTVKTDRTTEFEGRSYPYYSIEISSDSHPFYTGKQSYAKQDGEVAKFNKRFNRKDNNL